MSYALAIRHGRFGRAVLFYLERAMTRHLHRDGHLLFHVSGPAGTLEVGDRRTLLSAAWGVAVNPWEPHAYEPAHRDGTVMLVLYIRPSWFAELGARPDQPLRFDHCTVEMLPRLGRLVQDIAALLGTPGPAPRLDALLFDLVAECLGRSGVPTEPHPAAHAPRAGVCSVAGRFFPADAACDRRIRRSIHLMLQDTANAVELDAIAVGAGLSRAHFFKLFRDEIGATPGLVRNAMRLERALGELAGTPKPVTDIGFDLGFASTSSFSRFFALNTGLSPSEYRRAARIFDA